MIKYIYTLALFVGLANSFLQGQQQQQGKPVIEIKAAYYPDYQYTDKDQGVATGNYIIITGKTTNKINIGEWSGLPEGKTYPDNSLILKEIKISPDKIIPMENEEHKFKAMPAKIESKIVEGRLYLKGTVKGYGGNFSPDMQDKFSWYITSGKRGMDLATGVTNIPASSEVSYGAVIVNPKRIGDGLPDFIVTQIALPGGGYPDRFMLVKEDGKTIVGKEVKIHFGGIPSLGERDWVFLKADNKNEGGYGNGSKGLRIITFDLEDFGITKDNYKDVASLKYFPSNDSDPAFLAVDEFSMIVYRDDCEGLPDKGTPEMAKVGISTLQRNNENWLSESSGAYLELESSKKGFVITSNDNPKEKIKNPEEGMLVWDTNEKCLKIYNGIPKDENNPKDKWHCIEKCKKTSTPNP